MSDTNNKNLSTEVYEAISAIMKFIEKTESDYKEKEGENKDENIR